MLILKMETPRPILWLSEIKIRKNKKKKMAFQGESCDELNRDGSALVTKKNSGQYELI